jgi:hypothetical protein
MLTEGRRKVIGLAFVNGMAFAACDRAGVLGGLRYQFA